jgi:hypothetical protein
VGALIIDSVFHVDVDVIARILLAQELMSLDLEGKWSAVMDASCVWSIPSDLLLEFWSVLDDIEGRTGPLGGRVER